MILPQRARVAELVDAAGLKPATSRKGVYGFDSRPAHHSGDGWLMFFRGSGASLDAAAKHFLVLSFTVRRSDGSTSRPVASAFVVEGAGECPSPRDIL